MHRYQNLSGNSGVAAYETGSTFIRVRFVNDTFVYTYNYTSAGKSRVEIMKQLAVAGRGLSSYISRFVGENYADKTNTQD